MMSLDDILSVFGLTEARFPAPLRRGVKTVLLVALVAGSHRAVAGQWIWNWTMSLYRAGASDFLMLAGFFGALALLGWLTVRLRALSKQIDPKKESPPRYRAEYSRGGLLWYAWIDADKGPAYIEVQAYCPDPCYGPIRAPD